MPHDMTIGRDQPGQPVTLPKDHPNVGRCPHCGRWVMFRWGQRDFRAYTAREQAHTIRCTGKRPHFVTCRPPITKQPLVRPRLGRGTDA